MLLPYVIRLPASACSRAAYIAGIAWRAASETICSRLLNMNRPVPTNSESAPRAASVASRLDIAAAGDIENDERQTHRLRRDLNLLSLRLGFRRVRVTSIAIVLVFGMNWRSSSNRLLPSSPVMK